MSETITIRGGIFEIDECGLCGIVFVVPRSVRNMQRRQGGYSYCPNGHSWGFRPENSEEAQIRRERDNLKQQAARMEEEIRAARDAEQRALAALKRSDAEVKRAKKRAGAGVCQCCNRTFLSLASHMKNKHPAFVSENVTPLKLAKK